MVVADAPGRALLLFGDGLMEAMSPMHSHLHTLAAAGACGFLALRQAPQSNEQSGRFLDMQQLLDVHDFITANQTAVPLVDSISNNTSKQLSIPSIAKRFMGMRAALITNSEPMATFGESIGLKVTNNKVGLQFTEPSTSKTIQQLPNFVNVASKILDFLGLGSSPSTQSDSFELVLLHVSGRSCAERDSINREYLDWINGIVGEVTTLMHPGSIANDHLYLALVLSYANNTPSQANLSVSEVQSDHLRLLPQKLKALRPQQTYKKKNGRDVLDVRDHCPMLVVHKMEGVTRRDSATCIGFEEFWKNGCNLTILADRFLHEIAFKLWKAPKYGA